MALKEKFFAMLAKLDSGERQQLKSMLDGEPEKPVEPPPAESKPEPVQEKVEPEEVEFDEEADGEEKTEADEKSSEESETVFTKDEEVPLEDDETVDEEQPDTFEQSDAQEPSEQIKDEQGETVPVDFQQIIDGLNAKILALETENSALKAKTEGAFGLTSRTGELVKNNPLYDDDTSEIHFKK